MAAADEAFIKSSVGDTLAVKTQDCVLQGHYGRVCLFPESQMHTTPVAKTVANKFRREMATSELPSRLANLLLVQMHWMTVSVLMQARQHGSRHLHLKILSSVQF